jgi:hypothetical protein
MIVSAALALAATLAACGDGDGEETTAAEASAAELAPVKQYLTDHPADLVEQAYGEMEGIVAGVPRLAHYDVDIDAGSDASTPEDAVSFSLTTPDGKQLKQPGNLFFLTETALYGTNPDLAAKGIEPDVDEVANGNGNGAIGSADDAVAPPPYELSRR